MNVIEIPVLSTYKIKDDASFRAHLMVSNFMCPTLDACYYENIDQFKNLRINSIHKIVTK